MRYVGKKNYMVCVVFFFSSSFKMIITLVQYIPVMNLKMGKFTLPKDRKHIWVDDQGKDLCDLSIYQPEEDNFALASVRRGILSHWSFCDSICSSLGEMILLCLHSNFNGQLLGLAVLSPLTKPDHQADGVSNSTNDQSTDLY